jgi:hypothetical protein
MGRYKTPRWKGPARRAIAIHFECNLEIPKQDLFALAREVREELSVNSWVWEVLGLKA